MPSALRSLRQEQRELAASLRTERRTWVEIAAVFRDRYDLNTRAALRMVHDWSQRDAAEQWNSHWPADPKTFKNFSYWELWPGPTGHAPSLDVLGRLAELYQCSIADLVADCTDFRSADSAHSDNQKLSQVSNMLSLKSEHFLNQSEPSRIYDLISRLESMDVHEMRRLMAAWASRGDGHLNRRTLLLKLSTALTLAAASPAHADEEPELKPTMVSTPDGNLSGIWHSHYFYTSTGRASDLKGEHYVAMRHQGEKFIGESVPAENGSKLRLDLTLSGSIATGTWSERTSPTGYYRGSVYHGAIHLSIDPMGKTMKGMWVGFDRESLVTSDKWELNWIQDSTGKSSLRSYNFKA
jgi:hypothetical protein